jgi:hypothetical protein
MTLFPMVRRMVLVLLICGLLAPATVFGREPKKYQVTGKVLELTDDLIVVDKSGEKFEIGRDKDTKVTGDLKVGSKVTVEYRMTAASVEVKDSGKSSEKKK